VWLSRHGEAALAALPWIVTAAVALGLAWALGGPDAFGLTLGVLAATQAVWGGWRVERGMERIESASRRIERTTDSAQREARLERTTRLLGALAEVTAISRVLDRTARDQPHLLAGHPKEGPPTLAEALDKLIMARGAIRAQLDDVEAASILLGKNDVHDAAYRAKLDEALAAAWKETTGLLRFA
jgi:hypothetical protein